MTCSSATDRHADSTDVSPGTVVFVAGATGSLGRAAAEAALRRHATVILGSREAVRARNLADELTAQHPGATIHAVTCDVDDDAGAAATLRSVWERTGRLDAVISAIGAAKKHLPGEAQSQPYEHAMATKFLATVRLVLAATHQFKSLGARGRLAVVTGVGGRHVMDVHLPGGAANAALAHFVKGFGRVAAQDGVLLNAVSPGPVVSARAQAHYAAESRHAATRPDGARAALLSSIPLGREAMPAEVAQLLCFLAIDAPEYLVGEVVTLDGGLSRDPSR